MDLNYLKRLLKIFDESLLSELTIEEEVNKIHLLKNTKQESGSINNNELQYIRQYSQLPQVYPASHQVQGSASSTSAVQQTENLVNPGEDRKLYTITSPIVGTFYRSSSPEAEHFVDVGSRVTTGTTLCIVEAMKLMNEIDSDVSGIIEQIMVGNGEPVEYGQPLFLIKID